jgi:hypothetical protein
VRASVRVSDGFKTDYTLLGQPVTNLPTQAAPYLDPTPPTQGMVYAYRVRAVYAGGTSGYSNQDVATTFRYTGADPLVGADAATRHRPASTVRTANLTDLMIGRGSGVNNNPQLEFFGASKSAAL